MSRRQDEAISQPRIAAPPNQPNPAISKLPPTPSALADEELGLPVPQPRASYSGRGAGSINLWEDHREQTPFFNRSRAPTATEFSPENALIWLGLLCIGGCLCGSTPETWYLWYQAFKDVGQTHFIGEGTALAIGTCVCGTICVCAGCCRAHNLKNS